MRQLTIGFIFVLALTSCSSWVFDDQSSCPEGFWLQLQYTYNMLDVESAQKVLGDADVYVYDEDGNFVSRIHTPVDVLREHDFQVKITGLDEGNYQFVIWSGIGNGDYALSGESFFLSDFRIQLAGNPDTCSLKLTPLYHGYLGLTHYIPNEHNVLDVELMKFTNQITCLAVSVEDSISDVAGDFSFSLETPNSVMDAFGNLKATTPTVYESYVQDTVTLSDSEYGTLFGVQFGVSTLRLLAEEDTYVVLKRKSSDQTIVNLSLPQYIGMAGSLYTNLGRPLSTQEYFDRQDFYTIVFYLSGDLSRLIQVQVNSWKLRANNHIKL
jgi:hypothetical protein